MTFPPQFILPRTPMKRSSFGARGRKRGGGFRKASGQCGRRATGGEEVRGQRAGARSLTQLKGGGEIDGTFIEGFQLSPAVLETILPSMQDMKMIHLTLSGLGSAGFGCLSSFLLQNSTLLELVIGAEEIDVGMARSFSKALSNRPALRMLVLDWCGLGNGAVLRSILCDCGRVNYLAFRRNKISSQSVAAVAGFIGREETQTRLLDLSDNLMSDADVPLLVDALRKTTTLRSLDVQRNRFTHKGEQALMKMTVLDTSDVASLVRSNHTCKLRLWRHLLAGS